MDRKKIPSLLKNKWKTRFLSVLSFTFQIHTSSLVRNAHTQGSETSSIEFSHDNLSICTRGGDDTVKLWDVRKFKHPVATAADLDNFYSV